MSNFQEPNGGYFKFRKKRKKSKVVWIVIIIIIAVVAFVKLNLLSYLFDSSDHNKSTANEPIDSQAITMESNSSTSKIELKTDNNILHNYPDNAVEFQNHIYCLYDISLSWSDAEKYCLGLGGHLTSINNSEEQKFIESLTESCPKTNIWIGGYLDNETWKWSDGSSFTYQNWDIDKPDNYKENEFYLRYANTDLVFQTWSANKGKWDDCAENASGDDSDAPLSSFGFVCEWVKT